MGRLGGGLALTLVGLAVLSGYIKDRRGHSRLLHQPPSPEAAFAGLGVAGVAAYRYLT